MKPVSKMMPSRTLVESLTGTKIEEEERKSPLVHVGRVFGSRVSKSIPAKHQVRILNQGQPFSLSFVLLGSFTEQIAMRDRFLTPAVRILFQ
jgi:hypothetical protein